MDDQQKIKYYAARYVYKIQNEKLPFPIKDDDGVRFKPTWKEWWEWKFKDSYHDYTRRVKRGKRRRDRTKGTSKDGH